MHFSKNSGLQKAQIFNKTQIIFSKTQVFSPKIRVFPSKITGFPGLKLRVQVNKGQRVGAPPRNFFFRGSNLPPLGGPPSQIESARHRYFWPKWAAKVTHRINKAFQKPIF